MTDPDHDSGLPLWDCLVMVLMGRTRPLKLYLMHLFCGGGRCRKR